MKYLYTNVMLGPLLRQDKYGYDSEKDEINWNYIGLNEGHIRAKLIQYVVGGVMEQYWPISDESIFNSQLTNLLADLADDPDAVFEVVEEDRVTWEAAAVAAKDPDANLTEQEKRNKARNELIEQAVVTYNGVNITASTHDISLMHRFMDTITRRDKKIYWKGYDPDTGDIVRVQLDASDFEAITDAVFDQGQLIHIESDTQMPVNPWPIEVV